MTSPERAEARTTNCRDITRKWERGGLLLRQFLMQKRLRSRHRSVAALADDQAAADDDENQKGESKGSGGKHRGGCFSAVSAQRAGLLTLLDFGAGTLKEALFSFCEAADAIDEDFIEDVIDLGFEIRGRRGGCGCL